jgi:hypothetical protein
MPRCSVHGRRKLGAHRLRHDRRRAPLEERHKSLQDDALETVGEAVLRWCEGDLSIGCRCSAGLVLMAS